MKVNNFGKFCEYFLTVKNVGFWGNVCIIVFPLLLKETIMESVFTRTEAYWHELEGTFEGKKWSVKVSREVSRLIFEDYLAALEGVTLPDDPSSSFRPTVPDLYYDGEHRHSFCTVFVKKTKLEKKIDKKS
jgi:hypothetical protein